jgi:hypothetical protein
MMHTGRNKNAVMLGYNIMIDTSKYAAGIQNSAGRNPLGTGENHQ